MKMEWKGSGGRGHGLIGVPQGVQPVQPQVAAGDVGPGQVEAGEGRHPAAHAGGDGVGDLQRGGDGGHRVAHDGGWGVPNSTVAVRARLSVGASACACGSLGRRKALNLCCFCSQVHQYAFCSPADSFLQKQSLAGRD